MDYNLLTIDRKRELLLNYQIAMYAFIALEQLSGCPKEDWIEEITQAAKGDIDRISNDRVEQTIANIEDQRTDIFHTWETAIVAAVIQKYE